MEFNFSNLGNNSFVSEGPKYLRPYNIYEVVLSSIKKDVLKGKDGTEYSVVNIEFSGDDGIYTENLFVPTKDDDFKRRTNPTSGVMYPSSFERFQYTLMQIVEVLNPTGAAKIKENGPKIKTLDQFVDLILKALANVKNEKVFLKLVGRNINGSVYAALPNSCVLAKNATAETKPSPINFISRDKNARGMEFSNYEMSQMKAYQNAKPTPMSDDTTPDTTEDVDLDNIEL